MTVSGYKCTHIIYIPMLGMLAHPLSLWHKVDAKWLSECCAVGDSPIFVSKGSVGGTPTIDQHNC